MFFVGPPRGGSSPCLGEAPVVGHLGQPPNCDRAFTSDAKLRGPALTEGVALFPACNAGGPDRSGRAEDFDAYLVVLGESLCQL